MASWITMSLGSAQVKASEDVDAVCARCRSMTTTSEGLMALFGNGFDHNYCETIKNAKDGCGLCQVLYHAASCEYENPINAVFLRCTMRMYDDKSSAFSNLSKKNQIELHESYYSQIKPEDTCGISRLFTIPTREVMAQIAINLSAAFLSVYFDIYTCLLARKKPQRPGFSKYTDQQITRQVA